jgi:early secretory antigenic target protein ESAT-6
MATSTAGDQIRVPFSGMSTGVTNINQTYKQLQTMFDELQTLVNTMSSTWDGQASAAYQGVQKKWNNLSATLNTGLNGIGTKVDTARTNFAATEKQIMSIWPAG